MAQLDLDNIERIEKQRNSVHEKVYTTYTSFEMYGEKYIQIDTYGRSDRENPGKISQSLQLNRDTAKYLIDLIYKELDL